MLILAALQMWSCPDQPIQRQMKLAGGVFTPLPYAWLAGTDCATGLALYGNGANHRTWMTR